MKILVTGATGNVGGEILSQMAGSPHEIIVGTRDGTYPGGVGLRAVRVDFERRIAPDERFGAVFLMRPPHLTDPDLFADFLEPFDRATRVVFLSVQGADTKSYLPHAKIEKRILRMGFKSVFIRPSYFMDNLLTTLWPEMRAHHRIYLPAGNLKLDWVSVRDVAAVSVRALTGNTPDTEIEVCSGIETGFDEVSDIISSHAGIAVSYKRASLPEYIFHSRRSGADWSFILVMLLLHYLPRFRSGPRRDGRQTEIVLGRPTETLDEFAARHEAKFAELR